MATDRKNYLYLYDLPRDKVTTSVRIAEVFKDHGIDIGTKKPQINRDLFRPFYSAIVHIENPVEYEKAKEQMRYFKLDGCQSRSLPYDKDLRGDNKAKVLSHNVFFKLPKGADKSELNYDMLHNRFSEFGSIKSCKISLNPDFSNRGFAFVCFDNEDGTKKCLQKMEDSGEVFKFNPRDARDVVGKIVNNLYFKNIPMDMPQEKIEAMFKPFGDIKSLVMFKNEIGQFGFVCYEDKTGKDRMHGHEAVKKAVEALQDKDMGNGLKLYVRNFLNKQDREREKFVETIRYKNSKKRCNLYVKNFPASWTEEQLTNLFRPFGELEKVKVETTMSQNTYAFICFKKPDACSQAKNAMAGQTFEGKGLIINQYEIKEIRDLQLEEMRDKRDWENYIAQHSGGLQWNQLTNQPNLSHIIQQLLSLIQQSPPQVGNSKGQGQGNRNYQSQGNKPRPAQQNFQQSRAMPMQPGMPGMPGMPMQQRMPQPGMMNQPMMPAQPAQSQAPPQPAQPQQQMAPGQRYVHAAAALMPSIQERNPYMKEQVGHLIFDYVQMMSGAEKAPKITGMLIELPVPQIRQYLTSFEGLQVRVEEASRLLDSENTD